MKKETKGRARIVILNIIRFLLIIALLIALDGKRNLILLFSGIALFLTFIPALFKKFLKIDLPASFEIIVIMFIYGLLIFLESAGVYYQFAWFSFLIKLAAAIALGFLGLAVMYAMYKGKIIRGSPIIIAFFSFCFAVAVGSIWEIFEFSLDKILGFSLHVSEDTMTDMLTYMVGAFLVSSIGYSYIKNGKIIVISGLIEKFVEKNHVLFGEKLENNNSKAIQDLIGEGEGHKLEFKSTLRTNLHTKEIDKKIEHSILKTIVAYLNSNGGTLLVGISDKGEIIGLENDNFMTKDKAHLHLNSLIKAHVGGEYLPFIKSQLININGKNVLKIDCNKSQKEVFLKIGKDEEFYVRNGASSVELSGSSLIDYIYNNFRKSL